MFAMDVPWWQLILRALVVYAVLLLMLRLSGKRHVGQLTPFDLLVLLLLSDAVQNSMTGGDNSIQGGLLVMATLISLNYLIGVLSHRSKRLEAVFEGFPVVLIHNGIINRKAMDENRISMHELNAALRAEGCLGAQNVHVAMLETSGHVTVIPKSHDDNPGKK